ncbi:hypothetical protein [Rubripirellula lacrimiformis]|nr:hypothetical protein [Rubripirellula lacrimiformis]
MIASLAAIESPDVGLSATISGSVFLPVEGQVNAGALLLTDHKIKSSDALKQLVSIGPGALPALLAHLDDPTPTKLKIEHGGSFGAMWFASEIRGNPVSRVEQSVLQARLRNKEDAFHGDYVDSYTVKVGDVCLVAVGQITGRAYQAVRYQPTACIVLNSPTDDPDLCSQIRAIWQSDDPTQRLFDSLLFDYATRGKYNGVSLDGWSVGSDLQKESAMRLLYYYPDTSGRLIAGRLRGLDVRKAGPPSSQPATDSEMDVWISREVANGVRTDEFIEAVVWCKHPAIVAEIKSIANRTDDDDIIKLVGEAR